MTNSNKGLLALNVILTLAVGWLLFDRFTSHSATTELATAVNKEPTQAIRPVLMDSSATPLSTGGIAFFFMDSIQKNYNLIEEKGNNFRQEGERLDKQLKGEMQRAKQRYEELLAKDHTYSTQADYQKDEAEAQALVQKIQTLQARSEQDLAMLEGRMLEEISDNIIGFLKEFNAVNGYDYIFSVQNGGQIWVGDAQQNVTDDIVNGLNQRHAANRKDKPVKK